MMARLQCIRGTQYAFVVTQNWDDLLERAGYERCVPTSLNDYGVPLAVMAGAGAGQEPRQPQEVETHPRVVPPSEALGREG